MKSRPRAAFPFRLALEAPCVTGGNNGNSAALLGLPIRVATGGGYAGNGRGNEMMKASDLLGLPFRKSGGNGGTVGDGKLSNLLIFPLPSLTPL